MNALQPFAFGEQMVRIADQAGEPWFVGRDVCAVLDHKNHRQALSRLSDDEKGVLNVDTLGGIQEVVIISEAGMYRLVLTSRTEKAEAFKKWVVSEVLPSIRKTGRYDARGTSPAPTPLPIDFDTPEGREALHARRLHVLLVDRIFGRAAAEQAYRAAGLPEYAEELFEEKSPTRREEAFGDWLRERVEWVAGAEALVDDLYDDFCVWAGVRMQDSRWLRQNFTRSLKASGVRIVAVNGRGRDAVGVRLKQWAERLPN